MNSHLNPLIAGILNSAARGHSAAPQPETITLPLADVRALVKLAWEQTRYIEETDKSATGSIYGIEYADKTIARVAAKLPGMFPAGWSGPFHPMPKPGTPTGNYLADYYDRKTYTGD